MVTAITALVDVGYANGPRIRRACLGLRHECNGDVVVGVHLQGDWVGIITVCFPLVNRFDI